MGGSKRYIGAKTFLTILRVAQISPLSAGQHESLYLFLLLCALSDGILCQLIKNKIVTDFFFKFNIIFRIDGFTVFLYYRTSFIQPRLYIMFINFALCLSTVSSIPSWKMSYMVQCRSSTLRARSRKENQNKQKTLSNNIVLIDFYPEEKTLIIDRGDTAFAIEITRRRANSTCVWWINRRIDIRWQEAQTDIIVGHSGDKIESNLINARRQ